MNSRTLAALGLTGWTPIRLFWANGEPCVDWCRLPAEPLREPFFEQSVGQAMCSPARMLFRRQTSADVLEAIGREVAGCGTGVLPVDVVVEDRPRSANSHRNEGSPQEFAERAEASEEDANTASATSASSCAFSGSERGGTDILIGRAQHGRDARATTESPRAAGAIVPPAGFVFHVSRCGSTLISQMFAALSRNLVLSEPSPVDQVLTAHLVDPRVTRERRIAWLRGVIAALCQPRTGEERHAFIKFECLSVIDHELIAEAFPEVPRVFLYRNPVEVLVSLQRSLPAQMLPGVTDPRRLGIEPAQLPEMSLEEYAARVLAPVYAAGVAAAGSPRMRLVDYTGLPEALWAEGTDLLPVVWTADEIKRMQQIAQRDAKHPERAHVPDSQTKHRAATPEVRTAAQQWLNAAYARLEALRLADAGSVGCSMTIP